MSGSTSSFATFGDITFELIGAFESLDFEDNTHYAKIDVIGAPPVLQWIFDDLTKIRFSVKFHQQYCDPAASINALQQARQAHNPAAFTIGDDNRGNYIITKIEESDTWRADDGTIISASMKIELLQWAGMLPQSAPSTPSTGVNSQGTGTSPLQTAQKPSVGPPSPNFQDVPLASATRLPGNAAGGIGGSGPAIGQVFNAGGQVP